MSLGPNFFICLVLILLFEIYLGLLFFIKITFRFEDIRV